MFEAKYWKAGKHWVIESSLLDVCTQGTSKANALAMLADAIESLVNAEGFKVEVRETSKGEAVVDANNRAPLIALALKNQRLKSNQSLADIAAKLGQSSRNVYARYEQGKAAPSAERLVELLRAVMPEHALVLRAVPSK